MIIGHGFFIIRFANKEDRVRVLRDGPWFVNYRFLSIRAWEPNFSPSTAKCSAVAVWLQLQELLREYYSPNCIKKAVNKLGPLLKVDNCTALGGRAQYVRVCVQIDLAKPLPRWLWFGN